VRGCGLTLHARTPLEDTQRTSPTSEFPMLDTPNIPPTPPPLPAPTSNTQRAPRGAVAYRHLASAPRLRFSNTRVQAAAPAVEPMRPLDGPENCTSMPLPDDSMLAATMPGAALRADIGTDMGGINTLGRRGGVWEGVCVWRYKGTGRRCSTRQAQRAQPTPAAAGRKRRPACAGTPAHWGQHTEDSTRGAGGIAGTEAHARGPRAAQRCTVGRHVCRRRWKRVRRGPCR
jgi:hypothetical protein